MKKFALYIFLSTLLFGLNSCEILFLKAGPSSSPQGVFDQVWDFTDKKYSFFEYKNIDWKDIKTKYQPRIGEYMSDEELFNVCADMLGELKDGHVNLVSDFDYGRNWSWYLDYPENYNASLIERNYFKAKQKFVGSFTVYDFGDVLYVYYGEFSAPVTEEAMDYIIDKLKDKKGLIFDIRGNPGGSIGNVDAIAERFVSEDIEIGKSRIKSGPGREDYRDETLTLKFNKKLKNNEKTPIILLTNRNCYSAANFFTMYMKALPQVTVLGDKTGGGGGIPVVSDLSNGWKVRVSASQTLDKSSFNIENGVPPDVKLDLNKNDENIGKDTILEGALSKLRN